MSAMMKHRAVAVLDHSGTGGDIGRTTQSNASKQSGVGALSGVGMDSHTNNGGITGGSSIINAGTITGGGISSNGDGSGSGGVELSNGIMKATSTNSSAIARGRFTNTSTIGVGKKKKKKRVKDGFSTYYYSYGNYPVEVVIAIVATCVCTTIGIFVLMKIVQTVTGTSGSGRNLGGFNKNNNKINNNKNGGGEDDEITELGLKPLPYNSIYRIPESIQTVGDRTSSYAKLRHEYDTAILPKDHRRSLQAVSDLFYSTDTMNRDLNLYKDIPLAEMTNHSIASYDIHNCPMDPPPGYPYQWNIMDIITNWSPDDVHPPPILHQGLCVFDYTKDYDKAVSYRLAELPFIVMNDPEVARTVERWNSPGYMEKMLGNVQHRTEYSENNHFMYYVPVGRGGGTRQRNNNHNNNNRMGGRSRIQAPEGWKAPTQMMRMTYRTWLDHANVTSDDQVGPDQPHWYYRLIGCGGMGNDGNCDKGSSEYLFDEMPFFQPRKSLYIVDPAEQKGIHCRFGMKGVIAENHFDASRNMIVVLGGSRRYILSHPNQCSKLALYPKKHPSARHSAVDWSDPDIDEYPDFATATANEVILQPGHVLYLPTDWFHFIVSLTMNYQCNTRSGVTNHYSSYIKECGF